MFDASMPTILATPLIAAAIIALFLRRQGNLAAGVSVAAAGILCVLSLKLIFGGEEVEPFTYKWLELGALKIDFGFLWNCYCNTRNDRVYSWWDGKPIVAPFFIRLYKYNGILSYCSSDIVNSSNWC